MATKEEIQHFLQNTPLTKYQRISLPYGLEVPGRDQTKKIDVVFRSDLSGKSVLDVGCYYGLFAHEARKRGASRVVGVELDPMRFEVARKISSFLDDSVEILQGDITQIDIEEKFDIVLFLSVLHHIREPIDVMRRLSNLCTDTVIVEFGLPTHPKKHKIHQETFSGFQKLKNRIEIAYQNRLIQLLSNRTGLITTGETFGDNEFDWTYFYNQEAFRTIFMTQHKMFSEIQFVPGPLKRNRVIAFCKVAS